MARLLDMGLSRTNWMFKDLVVASLIMGHIQESIGLTSQEDHFHNYELINI